MRKYFFGYLFVKIAKLLALLALIVGVGYCLWKYGQAHLAADSASYRSSDFLENRLAALSSATQNTERIVKEFVGPEALGQAYDPSFVRDASSNGDFESLRKELEEVDQNRERMKEAVTARFNKMITEIEDKLRARAADLAAAIAPASTPTIARAETPAPVSTPLPPSTSEKETLYVENLGGAEIQRRTDLLEKAKQLLIVLQTAAENPQNRQVLTDAQAQLEQLETLLPTVAEPVPIATPLPAESTPSLLSTPTPPPKTFNAEKVANQLRSTRMQVSEAILSSWALDEAFEQASEAVSIESAKCRVASLAVQGIWLSFFGQIGMAVLAAMLIAFLILVFADLTQTLLDTATNTGITADAQKAIKPSQSG